MENNDPVYLNLQRFANEHKVLLEDHGEVGFGRPAVGFVRGTGFIDHNPYRYTGDHGLEDIAELKDKRLYPPDGVGDAYHKHDCLCVLVHDDDYDTALRQLNVWVEYLESLGPIEIVEYSTGATGVQAIFSGIVGYAIRIKQAAKTAG